MYKKSSFTCLPAFLIAQTSFIEVISKQTFFAGDAKLLGPYTQLESDPNNLSVTPIRLNDIWDFQSMGEITFTLLGVTDPISAIVTVPKRYSATHYEWAGEVIDSSKLPIGRVVFIRKGDKEFGRIQLSGRRFIIRDLESSTTNDDQVLIEINQAALGNGGCGSDDLGDPPTGPGDPQAELPPGPPTCQAAIRILFLYTQEVLDSATLDPESMADLGLVDLNEALEKSGIPDIEVVAVNAGVKLLTSFTDDESNAVLARNRLADNPEADSLRIASNADLVVLYQTTDIFIIDPQTNIPTDIGGIAYINDVENSNDAPDIDKAYSVIEAGTDAMLLVHEIGHLLGCRHLYEEDPHEYANANRFCLVPTPSAPPGTCNQYKRTIMTKTNDNGEWVLRYSNPYASGAYQGRITGITGTDSFYNALMISLTACHVEQFGDSLGGQSSFVAFISGPYSVYNDPTYQFNYSSYYWACDSTVTYEWDISFDYQATWDSLSTSPTATLDGGDIPLTVSSIYLRLKTKCGDGNQFTDFFEAINWSAPNLSEIVQEEEELTERNPPFYSTMLKNVELKIYPNPTAGTLNIGFDDFEEEWGKISLVSMQGTRHLLYEGAIDSKINSLSFAIGSYPAGYYAVELQTSTTHFRQPLIIAKR